MVGDTERATVMLLDDEAEPGAHTVEPGARTADPGEHAVEPGAGARSGGHVLTNGRCAAYPDLDTAPLAEAPRLARHLLDSGMSQADVTWGVDRRPDGWAVIHSPAGLSLLASRV